MGACGSSTNAHAKARENYTDIIEIDSTDSSTIDFTDLPEGELDFDVILENFKSSNNEMVQPQT